MMRHDIVVYVPVCICDSHGRLIPERELWLDACVRTLYESDMAGVEKVWFRDNTPAWRRSKAIVEDAMVRACALDKLALCRFEDVKKPDPKWGPLVSATWNILQGVTDMFENHLWATEVAMIESDMALHPEWLTQCMMLLDRLPAEKPAASVSCYLDSCQHRMRRFDEELDCWTQVCEPRGGVHLFTREFWQNFDWSMTSGTRRIAWDKQYHDACVNTPIAGSHFWGVYYTAQSYAEHLGGMSLVNPRVVQHHAELLETKRWRNRPSRPTATEAPSTPKS